MAVEGLNVVLQNLGRTEAAFQKWTKKRVEVATGKVFRRAQKNMNKVDSHTLERLAEMGHPYAKRSPRNPHDPPYIVHNQSGRLLATLFKKFSHKRTRSMGFVGVDERIFPHARWVILGTAKMISRNFLTASLGELRDQIEQDFLVSAREVLITVSAGGRVSRIRR